jgi:hypothetical protein
MTLYRYADVTLASAWPLDELRPVTARARRRALPAAITICAAGAPLPEPEPADWLHTWRAASGDPALALARTAGGYLLRFPHLADFSMSADGRRVQAWPAPGVNAETVRHLLLDQALPRLLAHQGRLALHAGAARVGAQAIAWLGPTGAGKSTLAASFHSAGYPLLSDDGLLLSAAREGVQALGTYPSLRLWPAAAADLFGKAPPTAPMAHYSSKQRLLLEVDADEVDGPLPLKALFVLAPVRAMTETAVTLIPISARAACMALITNAFQLDVTDKRRAADALALAAACAARIRAFRLVFPRAFGALPAVRAAMLQAPGAEEDADGPAGAH